MPKTQRPLMARTPFRVLSLLSNNEVRQFVDFVGTDLATGQFDNQLHQFLSHCVEQKVWEKDVEPSEFFDQSGISMSDNTLNKVVSRMYQQLQRFIAIKALLERPNQCEPLILAFLAEKSIEMDELEKKITESHRVLKRSKPNASYFRSRLDLQLVKVQNVRSRSGRPEHRK